MPSPRNAKELGQALAESKRHKGQLDLLAQHPTLHKKAGKVASIADELARQEESRERTDALVFARQIALAALPRRPTDEKSLSRDLRLGKQLWVRVTYYTQPDGDLPYGQDRFVLAAAQHLALQRNSPIVTFQRVGDLLRMYGIAEGGGAIGLLRERFQRLSELAVSLTFGSSEAELEEKNATERMLVFRRHLLPSRADLEAVANGQLELPTLPTKEGERPIYGIELSADFWEHLQDQKEHLIVPIELLKLFIDAPLGWDYLCFLIARCGRAQSSTVVDHEVLMELFGETHKSERTKAEQLASERNTIRRLQRHHRLIMTATRGNLKASLEPIGHFPKEEGQRGRRRIRWGLKIHPSKRIVFSGKKELAIEAGDLSDSLG